MGAHPTGCDVKTPLRSTATRQGFVQVALIPGDLLPDPIGWLEGPCLVLRAELDLRHNEPLQVALVDVDLDLEFVARNHVSALVEPAPLGERPEALEGLLVDFHLGLVTRDAGAAFRRQHEVLALATNPDLAL